MMNNYGQKPGEIRYTKLQSGWGIRGLHADLETGAVVDVIRSDGGVEAVEVGEVVWESDGVQLATCVKLRRRVASTPSGRTVRGDQRTTIHGRAMDQAVPVIDRVLRAIGGMGEDDVAKVMDAAQARAEGLETARKALAKRPPEVTDALREQIIRDFLAAQQENAPNAAEDEDIPF